MDFLYYRVRGFRGYRILQIVSAAHGSVAFFGPDADSAADTPVHAGTARVSIRDMSEVTGIYMYDIIRYG